MRIEPLRARTSEPPRRIHVYGSEAIFDFRLNHTLAVVKAALDVNADKLGPVDVHSTGETDLWMNRSRALASIQQGKDFIHVISSFASPDLDEKLLPIRISIAASVLGERIFLMRPERRKELDAIRTLGLSAPQVLVVPRVLALVLTLPLLVFVGNMAALAGAMVMSNLTLDITPQTFMERLHVALAPRHYLIGLGKSPVFALFIAIIGCRMGLSVSRDTRSIGINTTSTVVQGIVAVILLDALFAVVFQELDL